MEQINVSLGVIRKAAEFRDEDTWRASTARMMDERQGLQDVYGRWDDVVSWVREQDEGGY